MSSQQVLVTIMRRGEGDLAEGEAEAISAAYPGMEVVLQRTDPRDYHQHSEECAKLQPAFVLLPLEKPIPSQAMEEGVRHVAYFPDGRLMELMPIKVEFKPFVP